MAYSIIPCPPITISLLSNALYILAHHSTSLCSAMPFICLPANLHPSDHVALRPQMRGCLLGTGIWGEEGERVKARPQIPPEKDRRDRGPRRTMEVLRRCPLAIAQRLVLCAIAVSTAVLGQSHNDNVRCIAAEEQPEAKEVQLSQPSSTSLLMSSSGLI